MVLFVLLLLTSEIGTPGHAIQDTHFKHIGLNLAVSSVQKYLLCVQWTNDQVYLVPTFFGSTHIL